jgi:hypothetical protein
VREFENRVLKRIIGLKEDEIVGGWRKLDNGELHNLHSSADINIMMKSKRIGWAEHLAHMGERNACKVLVENLKVNRPVGRPRCRWKNNIKLRIRELG